MKNNVSNSKPEKPLAPEEITSIMSMPVMAPEQFSSMIGLHVESIRRAIRSGRIKATKFGPYWRIPRAEAERILQQGLPSDAA